uniref:Secreted protein n=1 Tax=Panagrellus redivivus TaxID=6233 RepID=A0A7E4ZV52_PANRE
MNGLIMIVRFFALLASVAWCDEIVFKAQRFKLVLNSMKCEQKLRNRSFWTTVSRQQWRTGDVTVNAIQLFRVTNESTKSPLAL